jgi:hypothetical protein
MIKKTSRTKASFEKQKRGLKAVITGGIFEKQVGEFLSKQGYEISFEKKIGKAKFDVVGKKKDAWGFEEYCVVECKKRESHVTATEVLRFMSKLRQFYEGLPDMDFSGKPEVQGLFAYTGELPIDARNAAKGFKPPIKFKEF